MLVETSVATVACRLWGSSPDCDSLLRLRSVTEGQLKREVYQYHYINWPDHGASRRDSVLERGFPSVPLHLSFFPPVLLQVFFPTSPSLSFLLFLPISFLISLTTCPVSLPPLVLHLTAPTRRTIPCLSLYLSCSSICDPTPLSFSLFTHAFSPTSLALYVLLLVILLLALDVCLGVFLARYIILSFSRLQRIGLYSQLLHLSRPLS